MRAVSCLHGTLSVVELPTPRPAAGQLLLDVRRCGICGSDLHARTHADELTDVMAAVGYDGFMRGDTPVVLGHEFCGEVVERGPGVGRNFVPGTTVVAFPLLRFRGAVHLTGLSPFAPGGYAEQVLTEAAMTFAVPNGLDVATAALTEPMAVALHAVRRSGIGRRDIGIVLGCGPVGLAVICHLKAAGVDTIVASDFSPARRGLAMRCGADVVIDPALDSPYETAARRKGVITSVAALSELGVGSMEKLRKLPFWTHIYRVAARLGAASAARPVIFECVGVAGMIDGVVGAAPLNSQVVVVGVCMESDRLRPAVAMAKEIDIRFVFGYTPIEFHDSLYQLAEGGVDASALVTGTVGLDGVDAAFAALGDPVRHAKILVDPRSAAVAPQ
jgi:threonine dehydrogenase-like Zn-dependent dehydrogenase